MDEAAAILAVAVINPSPILQEQLKGQAVQSPQAGADYILNYFAAVRLSLDRGKQQRSGRKVVGPPPRQPRPTSSAKWGL